MGEFLARNYPESAGGKQCATIAMASYLQGYSASPVDQRDFDKQRMVDIANYITRRWANQEEADEAWGILLSVAANERQLDKTLEYLGKIAPDSPRRGESGAQGRAGPVGGLSRLGPQGRRRTADAGTAQRIGGQGPETLEKGSTGCGPPVDAGTSDVGPTLASAALSLVPGLRGVRRK